MEFIYPFFVTFCIIFFSELGDKTQLLVLSFSTKNKVKNILLGVAIGTFFSHGLAILFGSKLASFSNEMFQFYLKFFTYASFLVFGIAGFLSSWKSSCLNEIDGHISSSGTVAKAKSKKSVFLQKLSNVKINYVFIVAFSIIVGELGDKTFLASLGMGLEYPSYKFSLILGSIAGMVCSNSVAIFCGKLLGTLLKPSFIEFLSNTIFIIVGIAGFLSFLQF